MASGSVALADPSCSSIDRDGLRRGAVAAGAVQGGFADAQHDQRGVVTLCLDAAECSAPRL